MALAISSWHDGRQRGWRNYGVLQVEPTDFCNLRCTMCAPQLKNLPTLHGNLPKGYLDPTLFYTLVDGLKGSRSCFDHLIFQWLGDPALHPKLPELVGYAHQHIRDRFQYFRIDTNAIALTPDKIDKLLAVYQTDPTFPILLVFSLDAVTPATYQRVKGAPGTVLEKVEGHIRYLLRRRAELPLPHTSLNTQMQCVLQPGNAVEVREFIARWDAILAEDGQGRAYDEIMIKRLSVGAGAFGQRQADALYDETLRAFKITPFDKPHVHLKIWEDRPWVQDAPPAPASGRPPSSAGMVG